MVLQMYMSATQMVLYSSTEGCKQKCFKILLNKNRRMAPAVCLIGLL